jgi:hypothetical protein
MASFDLFDALETRLSCSVVGTAQTAVISDDDTAPDPEPDPGQRPSPNDPIVYPPTPETGPVGPATQYSTTA